MFDYLFVFCFVFALHCFLFCVCVCVCTFRFPSTVSYALWGTVSVNKSGCLGNAMYVIE